jgi:hypothetical protein
MMSPQAMFFDLGFSCDMFNPFIPAGKVAMSTSGSVLEMPLRVNCDMGRTAAPSTPPVTLRAAAASIGQVVMFICRPFVLLRSGGIR